MKKIKRITVVLSVVVASLCVVLSVFVASSCVGCGTEKEKHIVTDRGVEWGVRIEVILKGGGTAILVCPKFDGRPMGAHGRECYLDAYDKRSPAN